MKKIVLVVLVAALAVGALSAQASPITAAGSKALVFTYTGFWVIQPAMIPAAPQADGSYSAGVGLSWFLEDKQALRSAVSFEYEDDGANSTVALGLRPEYLWYLTSVGPVAACAGAYLELGFGSGGAIGFGLGGEFGVEYFVMNRLSFSALYALGLSYAENDVAKMTKFGTDSFGVLMSLYF